MKRSNPLFFMLLGVIGSIVVIFLGFYENDMQEQTRAIEIVVQPH